MQPGEGALDDPAVTAKAGAVGDATSCDLGSDPALAEQPPVFVVVVATIGTEAIGAPTRASDPAAHRRHPVDERDQLGDVMAVTAGDRPGERDPCCVYEKVMLRAVPGSINRARARFGAPFFACT